MRKEYLLKELAARGFLPGYGFPTNIVNLNTHNIEDFINKNNKKTMGTREDNIYEMRELPTRGMDVAIKEYAPGAQVVIDGRVFRSAGVGLHWHTPGLKNEAQKFDLAWQCKNCGHAGITENAYSNANHLICSHCNAEIGMAQQKTILQPSGFLTDFYEETTNDISLQKYIRVETPRIQLEGEQVALPDKRCGFVKFGHKGSIFHHSSGEFHHGYAICMSCGKAESMTAGNVVPSLLAPDKFHRPIGGLNGSHKERDCSGEFVRKNVHLGFHTETDVLELFLRNPNTNLWLSDKPDDAIIAITLAVAIRDLIADEMGIASTEMGFGVRVDRDFETDQGRSVIQVYDQVSGGAGFVLGGASNVVAILSKLKSKLTCSANCDGSCEACLAGNDSNVEMYELDRNLALAWLESSEVLDCLSLPVEFRSIKDASYCSFDPHRVIRNLINSAVETIYIYLPQYDNDWDVGHIGFRDQLLSWKYKDQKRIILAVQDASNIDGETKSALASLNKLGIEVFEYKSLKDLETLSCPIQLEMKNKLWSIITNGKDCDRPNEKWLNSTEQDVWVTSCEVPKFNIEKLDVSGWNRQSSGDVVLEISSELNGSLRSLPERINAIIADKIPRLRELLDNDSVKSISYVDRYMRSPWTLMLFEEFITPFSRGMSELKLSFLHYDGRIVGRSLTDDWQDANDLAKVVEIWGENTFGIKPSTELADQAYKMSHGRIIKIEWDSGITTKLIFDQGMGYWRPKMRDRDAYIFNFTNDFTAQVTAMAHLSSEAHIQTTSDWPTFIVFSETKSK